MQINTGEKAKNPVESLQWRWRPEIADFCPLVVVELVLTAENAPEPRKKLEKLSFSTLFEVFWTPGPRGPGNPFSDFFQSFLGRGLFDSCRRPTTCGDLVAFKLCLGARQRGYNQRRCRVRLCKIIRFSVVSLPFVRIHSGNDSKILFFCICVCYEIKIMSKTILICYAAPPPLEAAKNSRVCICSEKFQNNFCLYLYLQRNA